MGEILIITHSILQQLYLIRFNMLLIVQCIPVSGTLKYLKNVAVAWMKCGKYRFSVSGTSGDHYSLWSKGQHMLRLC